MSTKLWSTTLTIVVSAGVKYTMFQGSFWLARRYT